ncbi:jg10809 [Pararge aegeria aegeria]|uniref:Jg10809 protein n=1 Tax=Pararge aegeria aegeria TaxID=348720 RepID=A0A8S4RBL9_9NEOP|nr:jg10809 [Pararge aegeria aegeria]
MILVAKYPKQSTGLSSHLWTTRWISPATWVNRCSQDLECLDLEEEQPLAQLSSIQTDKMTLFFTELLDHDRDDVICDQDFDNFFEKLAHFADWSSNSSEFHMMLEVKREFIEHFINPLPTKWAELPYYRRVCGPEAGGMPGRTTLEGWLARWALQLTEMKRFVDLPLYLQYLCKIIFHVIDRDNVGEIRKPAMAAFYRSVIGLSAKRIEEIIDTAYDRMTSNSYLILDYGTFVHCFTNWLMGKNPNGPGQWVLVPPKDSLPQPPFPVDYSALNTEPAKLEPYAPDKKTNRHSVIV